VRQRSTSRGVLEQSGAADEGAERLARLVAKAPDDEDLVRQLLILARAAERHDLALPALQETALEARRPEDVVRAELDLAEALAATGARDGALAALARAESALGEEENLGARVTLARRRAALGELDAALATLERGAEVSASAQPLLELARLARELGRDPIALDALGRAEERATGSELLELAAERLQREERAEAELVLRTALVDPDVRTQAMHELAGLLLDGNSEEPKNAARRTEARALLREHAVQTRANVRSTSLDRLVRSYDKTSRADALRDELRRAQEDPADPLAHQIAARILASLDRHDEAAAAFASAIEQDEGDVELRVLRARSLVRTRTPTALDEALNELAAATALAPGRRSDLLLERARILAGTRRVVEAKGALLELEAAARRSPELLMRAAAERSRIADHQGAAATLRRARRLAPDDVDILRALARAEVALGNRDEAGQCLLDACAYVEGAAAREQMLREIEVAIGKDTDREIFLNRLVMRVRENRFDREAIEHALWLLPRARRFGDVSALGELLMQRDPNDPRALTARSIGRTATKDVVGALEDVHARIARGETPDEVIASLASTLQFSDDRTLAADFGRLAQNAAALMPLINSPGHDGLCAAFLRGHFSEHGLRDEALVPEVERVQHLLGEDGIALALLLKVEELAGPTVVRTHRIGRLHHRLGQIDSSLERGEQLVALGAPRLLVESYVRNLGLTEQWEARHGKANAATPGGG
jgi:tetratricopeptide (TPR) repeat protein